MGEMGVGKMGVGEMGTPQPRVDKMMVACLISHFIYGTRQSIRQNGN